LFTVSIFNSGALVSLFVMLENHPANRSKMARIKINPKAALIVILYYRHINIIC
ncbi:MAG: hypothetical protein UU07_C0048G0001, partial [Parcubacteria group bacterium GW2011_GWF1_40_5]